MPVGLRQPTSSKPSPSINNYPLSRISIVIVYKKLNCTKIDIDTLFNIDYHMILESVNNLLVIFMEASVFTITWTAIPKKAADQLTNRNQWLSKKGDKMTEMSTTDIARPIE